MSKFSLKVNGGLQFSLLCLVVALATCLHAQDNAASSLGEYVYTTPPGWSAQQFPDGIVLRSQPDPATGEQCLLQMWPLHQAGANLFNDANGAFAEIFKTYEVRNETDRGTPLPTVVIRGLSGQGWEYVILKRGIRHPGMGPSGPWATLEGFVMIAKLDSAIGVVSGLSKDSLVSTCMGELAHNAWPRFFYGLSFRDWAPRDTTAAMRKALAGTWMSASATAGEQITFAGNGRFANAAARQQYSNLSSDELLVTTIGAFGNGSYTLRGNAMTMVEDARKNQPQNAYFRVEEESSDEGRTWAPVLYLLRVSSVDGQDYEVRLKKTK